MEFILQEALRVLNNTPAALGALLKNIPLNWVTANEGEDTWSPYDIVGHLVHGEKVEWQARIRVLLDGKGRGKFSAFDRFAQFEESKGKTITVLLIEFEQFRNKNLQFVEGLNLTEKDLNLTALHTSLGTVTLRQLLATWAAHDLAHINQITRVMAKQYKTEIGPWIANMNIMKERT